MSVAEKTLTHDDLAHFTGDLERWRHPLIRSVIHTPGVQHVMEAGQAHWLIDDIACYFPSELMKRAIEKDCRLADIQFWRLDVHDDRSATLTGRADSNEPPFVTQEYPYTDFPLDHVRIWAARNELEGWTLYLPSEH